MTFTKCGLQISESILGSAYIPDGCQYFFFHMINIQFTYPYSLHSVLEEPVAWPPTSSGLCIFALPYSNQWPAKQRRIPQSRL